MKGVAKGFLELSRQFYMISALVSQYVAMKEVKAHFRLEGVVLAVEKFFIVKRFDGDDS